MVIMRTLFPSIPTIQGASLCLRQLQTGDAAGLRKLIDSPRVYRYEPSFLFERQYKDAGEAILRMYDGTLDESIIWGIFRDQDFCGLAEAYGYRAPIHKISVGYRLLEEMWGQGIATEALRMMTGELLGNRPIEIITASTMIENHASARVLQKNGFTLVNHAVEEDWGFPTPTLADEWIL